jgi:hypothetical protein
MRKIRIQNEIPFSYKEKIKRLTNNWPAIVKPVRFVCFRIFYCEFVSLRSYCGTVPVLSVNFQKVLPLLALRPPVGN